MPSYVKSIIMTANISKAIFRNVELFYGVLQGYDSFTSDVPLEFWIILIR